MEFTQNEMAEIVASASSIYDRLDISKFKPAEDPVLVNEKLLKWKKRIDSNGGTAFQKRLAWDGLSEESVKSALGPVQLIDKSELPQWTVTFNACLQAVTPDFFSNRQAWLATIKSEKPAAFEDILLPFVAVARDFLHQRVGNSIHQLSDTAQRQIERDLLGKLSGLSGGAFLNEFSLMNLSSSPFARFGKNSKGKDELYQQFVKKMSDGGIKSFFKTYPVLVQLLGTCIDYWLDYYAEFMGRLESDWQAIEDTFLPRRKNQIVTKLELGLSDPHNNNRTVIGITFDSGSKIIYKPKNLNLDLVYTEFLKWFMKEGFPLPFKLIEIIPQSEYGWVEYIEQQPLKSEEEAVRYYQRAGVMVCLWYALMGTDCHYENLIAHGEYPIYIDLETLMCPVPRPLNVQAVSPVRDRFAHSVLTTSMLPRWRVTNGDHSYDVSALGCFKNEQQASSLNWEYVNTDAMALKMLPFEKSPQKNVPYLGGNILQPNDYLDEIVKGFDMMYRFILEKRDALLKTGILETMSKQKVRFIFRNTEMYGNLVRQSVHPKILGDGVDHQIRLDILSKAFLMDTERPDVWPIIRKEYASLKQQDIPFFTAHPVQESLHIDANESIPSFFEEPSYKQVVARIHSFDETDLKEQTMLIRASFQARIAHEDEKIEVSKSLFETALTDMDPASSQELTQVSMDIARQLYQQAIVSEEGNANWLGMKRYIMANRHQLEPLGYDLYDGSIGIALFLAAADKISGESTYKSFILDQVFRPLLRLLHAPNSMEALAVSNSLHRNSIGGASGLGSIAYGLTKISQLLDEPELLEAAVMIGHLITPERITADERLDLLLGTGGALVSLLTVYEATQDRQMKDLAVLCGEHLRNGRSQSSSGHYAWPTSGEKRLLTGFSHGAAGIAYSLLRLYEMTEDERYLAAAKDGIAYEQSVFSVKENNWPDWRRWETPKYDTIRWCSGAPGIGLGRLAGLSILNTVEIQQDIERAVNITRSAEFHLTDHLCCGNLGRAEIMMEIAKWSNDAGLLEDAYRTAAWIIARKQTNGGFCLSPFFEDGLQPAFYQGLAGMGYGLLRMANPDALPLILAWK